MNEIKIRDLGSSTGVSFHNKDPKSKKEEEKPIVIDYGFQDTCAKQAFDIVSKKQRACLLQLGTGFGKSFIAAKLIKLLEQTERFKTAVVEGRIPVLVVTKAAVVDQFKNEALKALKCKGVHIMNYEALSASKGELYINWKSIVKNGDVEYIPEWDLDMRPEWIIYDESQEMKNTTSLKHKVAMAAIRQIPDISMVFMSATPFQTVAEAKVFCMATLQRTLDDKDWPLFASSLCAGDDPSEISPRNMRTLAEVLQPYIIRAKGIRFKKKVKINCLCVPFSSHAKRADYDKAWHDYLEECAEKRKDPAQGMFAQYVALLKFRMRAEIIRADDLAVAAHDAVTKHGKAALVCSNFIPTLEAVMSSLISLGVDPAMISFIVGGQSKKERAEQKRRFQDGETLYCLYSLRAGGAGLSLHHHKPGLRPREQFMPPTWSGIEMVQAMGRPHRINSMSNTVISIIFYQDTVEEQVAAKCESRIKCLGEIVGSNETWVDAFTKKANASIQEIEAVEKSLLKEAFVSDDGDEGDVTNSFKDEIDAMLGSPEDEDEDNASGAVIDI